jgi:hypothetical protein
MDLLFSGRNRMLGGNEQAGGRVDVPTATGGGDG